MTTFTHPNDAPEGHKWQLANGWEFRLLEVIGEHIHGAYRRLSGDWQLGVWLGDGTWMGYGDGFAIIDAPRTHTVWVNLYERGDDETWLSRDYLTKEQADDGYAVLKCAGIQRTRIACITITEGEGL